MARSNWTSAYSDNWDRIFGATTPARNESRYFYQQLMQPFFRVDVVLGYDLDASQLAAAAALPAIPVLSFDDFMQGSVGHQILQRLPANLEGTETGYSKEQERFQERLDFFMQLPPGDIRRAAFEDICDRVDTLFHLVVDGGLSDGECNDFAPGILNGLVVACLRQYGRLEVDELVSHLEPFCRRVVAFCRSRLPPQMTADALNRFAFVASSLFGFLHIVHPHLAAEYVNDFLRIKHQIGELRWRQLDHSTRFRFAVVALHATIVYFPNGEPFQICIGVSSDSLRLLRAALNDACSVVTADGGSMYVPMMRFFIGKIDEGVTYSVRLYRTEIGNFTESDQFAIQRLVERFRHYRYPVTEERLVGFLSQFNTPKRMQLVVRLLGNVKFFTFGHLQVMIEEAFLSFPDHEQCTTVVPLGNLGGSTSLMSYLAAHWASKEMTFESEISQVLADTDEMTPICLIEDGAFSGTQLLSIFGDLLGTRQAKPHHSKYCRPLDNPQQLRNRPIRLCLGIATDKALKCLPKQFATMGFKDFQIRVSHVEVLGNRPFSPAMAHIWDTIHDQREAEALFKEIGEAILEVRATEKKWPPGRKEESALGFGNDQRLVIYQYNVPKSTLTALWEDGMYDGREWHPLFPADD